MPDRLSPAQIRGARGMLDWTMADLAQAARLSISTVKRAEGSVPPLASDEALDSIRDALETEGVQFLPDDGDGVGMRLRTVQHPSPGSHPRITLR